MDESEMMQAIMTLGDKAIWVFVAWRVLKVLELAILLAFFWWLFKPLLKWILKNNE
jgi:hypothetical protein